MPENRNPSNRQYDPDTVLGRALNALSEQGWDAKRISDRIGMDEQDVEQRLSSSRSFESGTGGTSGTGTGGTGGRSTNR